MSFGLTNSPTTFQHLMNSIFKPFLRDLVLVFFDDILIYSSDMRTHEHHLCAGLQKLREHSLFAKLSKCSFAGSKVEYIGHFVTGSGISTDPSKVEAITNWPIPTTIRQLRGFLGLVGYYRRFIQG